MTAPDKLHHLKKGVKAEQAACRFLKKHGLRLITKNYLCRYGEIDLIMRDREMLVFVEVRYRQSSPFGSPEDSIHHAKQQRLIHTAQHYLQKHDNQLPCRFDVVAYTGDQAAHWIQNAFSEF